jgi:hypothetical protein
MPFLTHWVFDHLRGSAPRDCWELRNIFLPLAWGQPIDFEQLRKLPDPLVANRPKMGKMLDIFGEYAVTPWFVSSEVKKVIEALEPDVHTFLPVRLEFPDAIETYFMLHVTQTIDAVIVEGTAFIKPLGGKKSMTIREGGPCILRGDLVKGKHLWRGARPNFGYAPAFGYDFFLSDEMKFELKDRIGVDNISCTRCDLL